MSVKKCFSNLTRLQYYPPDMAFFLDVIESYRIIVCQMTNMYEVNYLFIINALANVIIQ